MLSLGKVSNASEAATYYEEADDYYAEGGKAASQWLGSGAERLGLDGEVNAEKFKSLLEGNISEGTVIHNAAEGRRLGTDLTLSAPKSISMQALIGGDHRLIYAHEKAVENALKYAESLASYRITENGVTRSELSGNLILASFRHETNRNLDPNLHTHNIAINATQRVDGQWRALEVGELYRQQKLIGALYRSELALNVRELGYQVSQTHSDGRFELSHISRQQIESFSTRSQAIEQKLEERGKTRETASQSEKSIIALETRVAKQEVDKTKLLADWKEKSNVLGVNYSPELIHFTDVQTVRGFAKEALDQAVSHSTEREAVVKETRLIQSALEFGTGKVNLEQIKIELSRQVEDGQLIKSGERYTTQETQDREKEMLETEARGRNSLEPIVDRREAALRLAQTKLNAGQQAAAGFIASNEHRVVAIQGSAGVGKTTLLKEAQLLIQENGFRMTGIAPSASAAKELTEKGIESQTIARMLKDECRSLDAKTVLVVDESSMVSARDMNSLLHAVEEKQGRVVLMGDTQQLQSIESGRAFAQLQEAGIPRVEVGEVLRQKDKELKQAVEFAAKGSVGRALDTLTANIKEVAFNENRYAQIAKEYCSLDSSTRDRTLIVAGTNSARAKINTSVRNELGLAGSRENVVSLTRKDLTQTQAKMSQSYEAGDVVQAMKAYKEMGLGQGETATITQVDPGQIRLAKNDGSEVIWRPGIETNLSAFRAETKEFSVGDKVKVTMNDHALGLTNSDRGKVEDIGGDRISIAFDSGKCISMNTNEALHIDHAYAQTVHASQGQTLDKVIVEADTRSLTSNERAFYVAISRAESGVTIYTDDKEMLPESMGRNNDKQAALDLGRG